MTGGGSAGGLGAGWGGLVAAAAATWGLGGVSPVTLTSRSMAERSQSGVEVLDVLGVLVIQEEAVVAVSTLGS